MSRHIPNLLTGLRLLLAPLMAVAIVQESLAAAGMALGLAIAIEVTDWLDGWLARRFSWQSALGRFLDPLADSVARLTAFVALHSSWGLPTLPMLLVLLYRDQMVAYLRVHAAQRQQDVAARSSGKVKAVAQATAILGTLLFRLLSHPDLGWMESASAVLWSWRFMILAVLVTLYSAVDYLRGLSHWGD